MKRNLVLSSMMLGVTLLALSASASVSISLVAGSTITAPGGMITLTTFATSDGGETAHSIFGAITYQDAFVNPNAAYNLQAPLFDTPGLLTCTTASCIAFSQVQADFVPKALGITNTPIATTTFFVDPTAPPGTVLTFSWRTSPSGQRLDWFGITNAPGVTVTVQGYAPEPATAALLSVGLLGLALAARRSGVRRAES